VSVSVRAFRSGVAAAAIAAAAILPASAQTTTIKGAPNALQGFSDRSQPVQIEAASLEVRDKDKVATFTGNVRVVQGDTTMNCKSLVVYYEEQNTPGGLRAASPGPGGSQQISKLEARGGVKVVQKDQTATGDTGHFDMRANTVTLVGNVVVSQGQNVMQGDRLVVDLTTGVSRVEGKGPVRGLFQQQGQQGAPGAPAPGGTSSQPSALPVPRLGPRPFPSN